jgi:hypothetical protein
MDLSIQTIIFSSLAHDTKGRERNPTPCSRHLGQIVYGCVTLWRQSCHTPPPSPSLLVSCEIADRHPNQTICPTRTCCEVLTEIAGRPGSDFSHRGEKNTPYIVYAYTVHTFSGHPLSFMTESSARGPQSVKAPYHSLTIPHLFIFTYHCMTRAS